MLPLITFTSPSRTSLPREGVSGRKECDWLCVSSGKGLCNFDSSTFFSHHSAVIGFSAPPLPPPPLLYSESSSNTPCLTFERRTTRAISGKSRSRL